MVTNIPLSFSLVREVCTWVLRMAYMVGHLLNIVCGSWHCDCICKIQPWWLSRLTQIKIKQIKKRRLELATYYPHMTFKLINLFLVCVK